ncbi:hypothetical protein [Gordonia sp. NPDC003422]
MKLTKRAAQIAATLAIAGGAALGFSTLAATPAHADVREGDYTMSQSGSANGLNGVPFAVADGFVYADLPSDHVAAYTVYALHQTPNGGYADNGWGGRIVLRPSGNGYVGEQYLAGVRVADIALTPR